MHYSIKKFGYFFSLLCALFFSPLAFAQSGTLAQLTKFPEDLSNSLLVEYQGLYEDGWVADTSYLIFQQPGAAALLVRGVVPLIGNPQFTTKVQILIDDRSVIEKKLPVGEFTLQTEALVAAAKKKIELRFSNSQQLPAPDERQAAALIKFIGFVQPGANYSVASLLAKTQNNTSAVQQNDIFIAKDGIGLSIGDGWYPLEKQKGKVFRWVKNDAQFTVVSPPDEYQPSLDILIEPGPGVGLLPFELQIIRQSNNAMVDKVIVHGRETVRAKLSVEPEKIETFRLHIEGGGKATPNDSRLLNFRVFCITAVPQRETQAVYAVSTPPAVVATYAKKRNGMFDDGWIGKETEFLLPQLQTPSILSVRGKIIEAEGFTNEVRVLLNDKEVARKELKTGDFTLAIPIPDGGGVRKVKLFFAKETKLPNNDQRLVSALLTFIGFEAVQPPVTKQ